LRNNHSHVIAVFLALILSSLLATSCQQPAVVLTREELTPIEGNWKTTFPEIKVGQTKVIEVRDMPYEDPSLVSFLNPKEGWGGTTSIEYDISGSAPVFHYFGGTWHKLKFPIAFCVNSLEAISKDNVWFAGSLCDTSALEQESASKEQAAVDYGFLLHFDGKSWTTYTWQTEAVIPVDDISMPSTKSGWAVGAESGCLKFDGKKWTFVAGPDMWFEDCDATSEGELWAACMDGIVNFRNGAWFQYRDIPRFPVFREFMPFFQHYYIPHLRGSKEYVHDFFFSISMTSEHDGWAVGAKGLIAHYDGHKWESFRGPVDETLTCIDMINSRCGWAVSEKGSVLKYNGKDWMLYMTFPNAELQSVSGVSEDEAWIAGVKKEGPDNFVLHIPINI